MKKKLLFPGLLSLIAASSIGQQNYCNFEGTNNVVFGTAHTGKLDTTAANPLPDQADSSAHCAKYIRDTSAYAFIKMFPGNSLTDVTAYADAGASAPRITLNVLSAAPVGTNIILQLGRKDVDNYPAGIHSEYIATTQKQNTWETVTFNFLQKPSGSLASAQGIDKIVLLFDPGSHNKDSLYFDNLIGPAIMPFGIASISHPSFSLYQNFPNPASDKTEIGFQLNTPGPVSLGVYDLLGNRVIHSEETELTTGRHSILVQTSALQEGIYFYVLQKDGASLVKKMIVSR